MQHEHLHVFGDKKLLMGMQWQPVVGQVSMQQAKLLAKQRRAKQWVVAGHGFLAVGLSYKRVAVKKSTFSAAICHALLYPKGWHATIYKLRDDLYWLAAVHEGTPMSRGDKLFTNQAQALAVLTAIKEQYTELNSSQEIIDINDFLALVATHTLKKALLHSIRTSLLKPMVLLGLFVVWLGWWQFEPTPVEAASVTPDVDPYLQGWQQKNISPNGKEALVQLVRAWEQTPIELKGWQLKEIRCDAALQHWFCEYQYAAQAETATTVGLDQILPAGWGIKALNMQQAWLQVRIPFTPIGGHWLSAEQVRLQLLSQLQPIRPAFSALRLADPVVLLPQIAVGSSTHTPIYSQTLYFEGPMRSLALLMKMDEALHWEKASLHYKPQAQASLKGSVFQVNLQGVVYVRD